MSLSTSLKTIVITIIFGLGALTSTYVASQPNMQQLEGDISLTIQGGEWKDELLNSDQLSIGINTQVYGSHLYLELEEYLNWHQTWTVHFALGEFFHTEAISDSVRLALMPGSNQYFTTGIYTSTVFEAERPVEWTSARWQYSEGFDAVMLEYRTGNTPVPDNTWSNWRAPAMGIGEFLCAYSVNLNQADCISNMSGIESSHYIQYRANFSNDNPYNSVSLNDINIVYGIHPLTGTATSDLITPTDLLSWKEVFYTATVPISTTLTIDILSADGTVLIPDANSGESLTNISPFSYPSIKLRAILTTDNPSLSPEIDAWGVRWFVGYHQFLPIISR